MDEFDLFFVENKVKIILGRKRYIITGINDAHDKFMNYVNGTNKLSKRDGELVVGNEMIAIFSIDGRLWSSDEEEVIWR